MPPVKRKKNKGAASAAVAATAVLGSVVLSVHDAGRPRSRLAVCLRAPPRAYTPGSGPPPGRISLMPTHDSTAYITQRILLPPRATAAHDGKPGPKRMAYIVGWRNLPAARLLVPALDILDYVDPRELEAWETAFEEELNAERERSKLQRSTTAQDAPAPATAAAGKRKRGRPRAHAQIESAVATGLETADGSARGYLKGGALTLSTPPKHRIKQLESLSNSEDDTPADGDGTLTRQLVEEMYDGAMALDTDSAAPSHQHSPDVPAFGATLPVGFPSLADSSTASSPAPPLRSAWVTAGSAPPSARRQPQPEPIPEPALAPTPALPQKKKDKKKKPKAAQPVLNPAGEPEWTVKRIDNDSLFEVDGQDAPVRFFQVRWEGDWPPDQNPTWEPEENLPASRVRNYLKRGKTRRSHHRHSSQQQSQNKTGDGNGATAGGSAKKLKQSELSWLGMDKNRYGSVSEAFAGDENDLLGLGGGRLADSTGQDEDEDEELLVV